MFIKIKGDVIKFDEIMIINFNDAETLIFIIFKCGYTIFYGKELRQGMIPRDRIITAAEYQAVKDWALIDIKVVTVA